jgi:hypothetical protein
VVFVKSHVPTFACGPSMSTRQPARVTNTAHLKPLSRAIVPDPEGALNDVSLNVADPLQLTVDLSPNPTQVPPTWPKLRLTEKDDVPLAGVVPAKAAVVHEIKVPEYARLVVVELPPTNVLAGEKSAAATPAYTPSDTTSDRPRSPRRFLDDIRASPLSS